MMFFGKPKVDPIEQSKNWKRELTKESRRIEREISSIQREEQKVLKECKKLAQSGQLEAAKIIAKEVVQTRKAVERMYTTRAQLNSATMMIQNTIATVKLQGCMSKSVEVMEVMNKLVGARDVSETMGNLAREMARMGLIDEMVSDAFESIEPDGIETSADKEVDKVIAEITGSMMARAGPAPTSSIPSQVSQVPSTVPGGEREREREREKEE
eukprot:CAMPEP_0182420696 /NCGR_PEP_ID=MMETSP1167-20130531/5691_1 /TAXON_ID=2988 /ORGANISM="Mallomonas Sp, Strain CCMP3275" /LENGTH=212 /DNA_ID=CAMNT_0024596997 /DNA_START=183 /DNA_END=818 /DNA_ORIENTATION=+